MEAVRIENALAQRAHEQSALYHFTDRLYRARSLTDIYDAALDAIRDALGCPRASILRFDADGVMRFVAWRGLSETYRAAVDGHSPWRPGDLNAQPICVDDVAGEDVPEPLKAIILKEGIRALAFIPLTIDDKVIGKFMTYFETPREFTEHELQLSVTIARQLGFSIGRRLADEAAWRLIAIVESSDDAIFAKDLDGTITNWNAGAERLFGYSENEVVGKSGTMLIPSDRVDEELTILARLRHGERIDHYETVRLRKDGSLVDISLTVSPIKDADGSIIGVSKIARDITDRRRAQEKQQLLLSEMGHRIKNLFAVASSIVNVSARSAASPAALASAVSDRLNALARAHSLTLFRAAADGAVNQPATTMHALVRTILSPYDNSNDNNPKSRLTIDGPDVPVSGNAITPIALLLYEFATNAAKYGSLSTPDGSIDIKCAEEGGRFVLTWHECGGPRAQMQNSDGFGSKLANASAAQLDANLSYHWSSAGLIIRLSVLPDRLTC
ncbi:PAS domain S-box protein [Mesorhizobium sp. M5C.F.Cr.IN.023.01.1.1]|uniref:PAS domain S-box protein n=1 Tax=Mesorhizobium sp. M5C.F.Cr.IN.023.01.1.1 TaxID=2496768 RepID=UPI001FDEA809|nr:PAS domain S-box protein [Mesorhizobium sp. M5C.F.Cr.IN.023.01.1.1]